MHTAPGFSMVIRQLVLIYTTEWYINIDCISESLCKSFQGGPTYDNFQPAV